GYPAVRQRPSSKRHANVTNQIQPGYPRFRRSLLYSGYTWSLLTRRRKTAFGEAELPPLPLHQLHAPVLLAPRIRPVRIDRRERTDTVRFEPPGRHAMVPCQSLDHRLRAVGRELLII